MPEAGEGGDAASGGGAGASSTNGGNGGEGGGTGGSAASGAGAGGAGPTCPSAVAVPGTRAFFSRGGAALASPGNQAFFDYPWPELSRPPSELANFPNPASATGCTPAITDPTLALVIGAIEPIEYRSYVSALVAGYSSQGPSSAAIYLRFDGALATQNLPSATESVDPAASQILLVNVDGESPARGRIVPVLTRVFEQSRYLPAHTLSIVPHPGFPLEPGALYAAVVRRGLNDAAGQPLGSPRSFERLKGTGECAPNAAYRAAFDRLASLGVPESDVAIMSVFRAGTPTEALGEVIGAVEAVPDPAALASVLVDQVTLDVANGYYLLSGTFDALIHQHGTPPYLPPITVSLGPGFTPIVDVTLQPASPAGRFLTQPPASAPGAGSSTSAPRTERIDFRITVPLGAVEAAGEAASLADLPVVIYGPGTGGGLDSPLDGGLSTQLAAAGIATFVTDPVMHADRSHSENIDPELLDTLSLYDAFTGADSQTALVETVRSGDLFFNPLNLQAAKGNSLQAALDYAWQARVLGAVALQATLGGVERTVSFDPEQRHFFGHSQGAATGPLLARSGSLRALGLSAPSGHLPSNLLGKTKPAGALGIAQMLDYIVCEAPEEPVDVHHPFLNLLLHWFEEVDAANYAPLLIGEAEHEPKHVFVLSGTADQYVPRAAHDAVTTAARLQQLAPELAAVLGQGLLDVVAPGEGYGTSYASASGNLTVGGAAVTGAFRQYHDAACSDDHFVYACNAGAQANLLAFFQTAIQGSLPSVP